jgi:hypothetical protein
MLTTHLPSNGRLMKHRRLWEYRAMIPFRAVAVTATTTFLICSVALAATARSGHFSGQTSNRSQPITFSVAANKVRKLDVAFDVNCGGDSRVGSSVFVGGTFVIRGGRFSGTRHGSDGGPYTVTVKGRFTTPRKASGTVRVRVAYTDEGVEGSSVSCDTGTLRWSAHLG